jgi:hypothetical protein
MVYGLRGKGDGVLLMGVLGDARAALISIFDAEQQNSRSVYGRKHLGQGQRSRRSRARARSVGSSTLFSPKRDLMFSGLRKSRSFSFFLS